jgi:hypothetical protein
MPHLEWSTIKGLTVDELVSRTDINAIHIYCYPTDIGFALDLMLGRVELKGCGETHDPLVFWEPRAGPPRRDLKISAVIQFLAAPTGYE